MATVENIKSLQSRLRKLSEQYATPGSRDVVYVGYAAAYAIYVHERPAKHKPGKQWKFLEEPIVRLGDSLGDLAARGLRRGATMLEALYGVGLRIQRASQKVVPVDTGNLRGSAFTARENDVESEMGRKSEKLIDRVEKQSAKRSKKLQAAKKKRSRRKN